MAEYNEDVEQEMPEREESSRLGEEFYENLETESGVTTSDDIAA